MGTPSPRAGVPATAAPGGAGRTLYRALSRMVGDDRWRLRLWDGSEHGAADPRFVVTLRSRGALDRMLGALPERAFGRADVEGAVDVDPLERLFDSVLEVPPGRAVVAVPSLLRAALALGARPDRRAADTEAHLRGRLHSPSRDAAAIRHHYDLPVAFYRLFLGETMTYSCAYFPDAGADLDTAQRDKLDLVCRKLRLRPGERLLDIGCGYGSLAVHAAEHHGVEATDARLEVRDVESLREHYALTAGRWVDALGERWHEAVRLVGEQRVRLWRLYLTASAAAFRHSDINVHQILAVRTGAEGASGLPLRRADWYRPGVTPGAGGGPAHGPAAAAGAGRGAAAPGWDR